MGNLLKSISSCDICGNIPLTAGMAVLCGTGRYRAAGVASMFRFVKRHANFARGEVMGIRVDNSVFVISRILGASRVWIPPFVRSRDRNASVALKSNLKERGEAYKT